MCALFIFQHIDCSTVMIDVLVYTHCTDINSFMTIEEINCKDEGSNKLCTGTCTCIILFLGTCTCSQQYYCTFQDAMFCIINHQSRTIIFTMRNVAVDYHHYEIQLRSHYKSWTRKLLYAWKRRDSPLLAWCKSLTGMDWPRSTSVSASTSMCSVIKNLARVKINTALHLPSAGHGECDIDSRRLGIKRTTVEICWSCG